MGWPVHVRVCVLGRRRMRRTRCGTCRVRVLAGMENLSPLTVDERELREDFPDRFGPDERLACQCRPLGDVVVEVPTEAPPDLRLE